MALLRQTFPPVQEQAIASFNWQDIAEGTGIVKFYGYKWSNSTSSYYGLTTQLLYSEVIEDTETGQPGSFTDFFNQSFDSAAFNRPQIVDGTAYVQVCWSIDPHISDDVTESKGIITIAKWDGTTATTIGSGTTSTYTATTGATKDVITAINITCTETHLKVGEKLRVTVQLQWKKTAGSGTALRATTAHDPQNRDGTYITPSTNVSNISQMVFHIPFRTGI